MSGHQHRRGGSRRCARHRGATPQAASNTADGAIAAARTEGHLGRSNTVGPDRSEQHRFSRTNVPAKSRRSVPAMLGRAITAARHHSAAAVDRRGGVHGGVTSRYRGATPTAVPEATPPAGRTRRGRSNTADHDRSEQHRFSQTNIPAKGRRSALAMLGQASATPPRREQHHRPSSTPPRRRSRRRHRRATPPAGSNTAAPIVPSNTVGRANAARKAPIVPSNTASRGPTSRRRAVARRPLCWAGRARYRRAGSNTAGQHRHRRGGALGGASFTEEQCRRAGTTPPRAPTAATIGSNTTGPDCSTQPVNREFFVSSR